MVRKPTRPFSSTATLATGEKRTYYYAWKGGPPLDGVPGTPEFQLALTRALEERVRPQATGKLSALAAEYFASPEFTDHAATTRAEWSRHLEMIKDETAPWAIGGLPISTLSDHRVKQHLLAWRDQWRATPRKADYAIQVLSAVLSWAVERGRVSTNVLLGHSTLYRANRADQIWSEADRARFLSAAPSKEVGFIVELALLTALRRGDLLRLRWLDVGDVVISMTASKSKRRRRPRPVTIPLLDATLELLARIRAQQDKRHEELTAIAAKHGRPLPDKAVTVLSNTRGRSWSINGAEHQVVLTKRKAGVDKHLHDCRGSFATRLRKNGATISEIADVLGWEEARVERLMSLYVDTDAVVRDFAARLRAKDAARRN